MRAEEGTLETRALPMARIRKLTRAHVLAAFRHIDREGVGPGEWSRSSELIFKGRAYPPRYVVAIASALANRDEASDTEPPEEPGGVVALRELGFRIVGQARDPAPRVREAAAPPRASQAPPPRKRRPSSAPLAVFCANVGNVKTGKFGWAGRDASGAALGRGRDMEGLVDELVRALDAGRRCTLGFEAPLFVPLRDEPAELTQARRGEGKRSWSGAAGTGALGTGLVQVSWVLRRVKARLSEPCTAFTDWNAFTRADHGLLFWEAVAAGGPKPKRARLPHVADAAAAVAAFIAALPDPTVKNLVDEPEVFSLLGAALLETAWTDDLSMLSSPCLVLRPS